jgi:glucose/arabinose dehydrogenase
VQGSAGTEGGTQGSQEAQDQGNHRPMMHYGGLIVATMAAPSSPPSGNRRRGWPPGEAQGYKVVRLLFDASGKPTGEYEDFMTGFVVSATQVWGRPVGVAVANDGSLFVTEDGNGTIWRISHR